MRRAWDADDRGTGGGTDRMAFSGPIGDHGNYSGPLSGPLVSTTGKKKKSARFNIPGEEGYQQQPRRPSSVSSSSGYGDDGEELVEITLDVHADTVALHSVKPAAVGGENPEASLLDKSGGLSASSRLEKRSSFGSGFVRTASARVRQISEELRRLASSRPAGPKIDRSKSAAGHALKGLQFISTKGGDGAKGWAAVEKRFDELATAKEEGGTPTLARNQFGQCIGMKDSKDFALELFDALARRRGITSGAVTKAQLHDFWNQISDTSFDARLQTFFDMVDKNADGRVSEAEVREIISMSASANRLSKIQEQADEYAALIMEELDPNNLGYIEISNLETLLLQGGAVSAVDHSIRTGNSKNLSQMLSQRLRPTEEPNPIKRVFQKAKYFLEDNWKRCWVLALWFACCAGLFAWKFVQYRHRAVFHVMGYCVCAAKGGAETLKFNMALILLPVCRNTITWIRNKTKLGAAVPFDDNLNFHKVIAAGIVVGAGFHVISHLTCDFPRLLHATDAEYEPMKPFFGDPRPPNYWWFVKGTEGWTGLVMVVLMAIAFTLATPWFRRGKVKLPGPLKRLTGFNAFWYTHHLFIIVYALLIVHGHFLFLSKKWYKKTTWMYLAIPMAIYAAERLTRMFRSSVWPVKILKVAVYPGNVLTLQVSKPPAFRYKSGQYMFVNCRAVSPFEWHPFSITSAPGEDFLSVHIKVLGDWTRKLREVFSQVCREPVAGKSGMLRADYDEDDNRGAVPNFPRVLVDGPYGAPAQDYTQYDVVLLVGLGIGATPMISIVKDIVHNLQKLDEQSDLEKAANIANGMPTFHTKRAYFYWVTRGQSDFDWFRGVMNEVAESDTHGAIELHNYCTSVYEEGDARSALITMLQSLHHAKNGVDVVTGTRVKSHFAKPNWRNVYKRIAVNHKDEKVGVFYCGNPMPVPELRRLAADFSRKTTTKFDFHKENF